MDFTQLPQSTINKVTKLLRSLFISEFNKHRNTVTGLTNKSITVEVKVSASLIEWSVYGGGGLIWLIRGKKANTKLPMVNTGGAWDLLEPLRTWHSIITPDMPKFLLAKALAKKARSPIDIAGNVVKRIKPRLPIILDFNIGENILNSIVNF